MSRKCAVQGRKMATCCKHQETLANLGDHLIVDGDRGGQNPLNDGCNWLALGLCELKAQKQTLHDGYDKGNSERRILSAN